MRPTIALACILKNEAENISQLLESVSGCFDEIHFCDTGSTDGSLEILNDLKKEYPALIHLHAFDWIDDFAAARNASFAPVKTDYVMWMDLDDVLSDKAAFTSWRDTVMGISDLWLATYHYTVDANGKPVCSFARERVIKNHMGLKWNYFVHEGIEAKSPVKSPLVCQYATSWSVVHKRTAADAEKDKTRNLSLFQKHKDRLDHRMRYYYGKELFEHQKPLEAITQLLEAVSSEKLEAHDRIMGVQYAAMSAMQLNQPQQAISLAHQGMQLDPNRAEFYVIVGDCYVKLGKLAESMPFYSAASQCRFREKEGPQGAIYSHEESYKQYPLNQLAKVHANMGDLDRAEQVASQAAKFGPNAETIGILGEIQTVREKSGLTIKVTKKQTEDIIFSCHPGGPYEWDEDVYQYKGIGGSETAVVEMAHHLAKLTHRKVLVFNNRDKAKSFGGVHYLPASELPMYCALNIPKVNIAWRHNIKLTDAPTYVWCHDLTTMGIENAHFTKVLALSEFHRDFLVNLCGVKRDKILVTANGINPERWRTEFAPKRDPMRVIFSSSPDRGLDRAMRVMDHVVKEIPEARLEAYYGFDNMLKLGHKEHVARLQKMIDERPYVTYNGNVSQTELTSAMQQSAVWLYPTNFLETFCITALEAICSGTYPIVRSFGALKDTLRGAHKNGLTELVEYDCETDEEIRHYACRVVDALRCRKWEKVQVDPNSYAWERVALQWVKEFNL